MENVKSLVRMNFNYLGNKKILENYKIGFLCSRKVPADIILKTYDWAIEQREKGVCVVSGFHSKIEKDVFHYLSKGSQPIILVLARGMYKRIPLNIKNLLAENRLLIISPFKKYVKRVTKDTALLRNKIIIEISDEIKIPYYTKNGIIYESLKRAGYKFENTKISS